MVKVFRETLRRFHIKSARFAMLYALLAAAGAVLSVLAARVTGSMTAAAQARSAVLSGFLITLAAFSLGSAALSAVLELLNRRAGNRTEFVMRRGFARYLLGLSYRDIEGKNSGEGASIFGADLPNAAAFLTGQTLAQVSQMAVLLVSAAFMLYMNWWLTLCFFALFPLLAFLQAKLSAPIGEKRVVASQKRAEMNATFADALQNPMTVKAYGLGAKLEKRFLNSYDQFMDANLAAAKVTALLAGAGVVAATAPQFVLAFVACALVLGGKLTLAEFIAFTLVSGPVGSWLVQLSQDLARIRVSYASAKRLLDFTGPVGGDAHIAPPPESPVGDAALGGPSTAPASEPAAGGHAETGRRGRRPLQAAILPEGLAARFEGVSFSYTDGKKALDNLSLSIEKGKITALTGPSGCGKSTILKLLLGLYAPDSGALKVLEKRAYVPQDSYLLPVSIRENILGDLPYDEKRLREACQSAGILKFIETLPEGFDTVLSETAANISGGQKQRIAIARAFYQDADLLLLDESTSALDPETEALVLKAFGDYVKQNGKTAVVVAHRRAVMALADMTVRLAEGGVPA
ncbi:MAG: ABC transporter ATP-binding protein/permease [Firmicutes bacterium]|nr:ABC transporter ATP-binding protein/permease [Bacillota bacterium]